MKDYKRQFQYQVVLLAVLIGVAGYGSLYVLRSFVQEENDAIVRYIALQEIQEDKLMQKQAYQEQYESIASRNELFQGLFLRQDSALKLIESIEQLAREQNLSIEIQINEGGGPTVKGGGVKQPESSDSVVFQLEAIGAYTEFLQFLYRLENIDPLVSISGISVTQYIPDQTEPTPTEADPSQPPEGDAVEVLSGNPVKADISATFFYDPSTLRSQEEGSDDGTPKRS